MIGRGWWWVVAVELWLVVCGLGWWRLNYGWPWVVVVGRGETFFICYDAFIFKTKSVWEFFLFNKVIKANLRWYLLKRRTTWNNLKRPTTSKKRPETTYSNLQRARNDLTRPETTCNEQELTWNDLQRARNDLQRARNDLEITHNNLKRPIANKKRPGNNLDLQPARNNLKRPTTSKTQPTTTGTYLQRAKKRRKTTINKQILRLFYNMAQSVLFSNSFSVQHLIAIIRALLHGESWWK